MLFSIVTGSEAPKEKMDSTIKDLNQALDILEEKFLQNKPFIIGDKISLADLVAIVEIMQVGNTVTISVNTPISFIQTLPSPLTLWKQI